MPTYSDHIAIPNILLASPQDSAEPAYRNSIAFNTRLEDTVDIAPRYIPIGPARLNGANQCPRLAQSRQFPGPEGCPLSEVKRKVIVKLRPEEKSAPIPSFTDGRYLGPGYAS